MTTKQNGFIYTFYVLHSINYPMAVSSWYLIYRWKKYKYYIVIILKIIYTASFLTQCILQLYHCSLTSCQWLTNLNTVQGVELSKVDLITTP